MKTMREHIYLAALLHDIGKFYQRADTGSVKTSRYLKEHCKDESSFCPLFNGRYSHKHVLWTAQFIDEYRSVFQKLVKEDFDDWTNKNNLINLAAGHHLSNEQLSEWGALIKEADCLSSGMDRNSEIALRDEQDENTNWDAFKKKRMISVLETVGLSKAELENEKCQWHYLPVESLSLHKRCFPQSGKSEGDPDYSKLWEQFLNEFKFIQANTYHAFSETLLNLLFKYTTCIPASTINFSDVSLYDHLKTTAALAVCLYDVRQSEEKPENPFLLIGADLSGIQSYIYQVVSKYAGKNLKGRSFYLRILSDSIVRFLLKELGLFQANVVYNSGGGFYMIAPDTTATKTRLEKAVKKIEQQLFKIHGTALFVAIDSVSVSKDALMHASGEDLQKVWKELFEKREQKKCAKFASQIEEHYEAFFMPIEHDDTVGRDVVTGEDFLPGEKYVSEGELKPLKQITKDQIVLGRVLRESEIMVISTEPIAYWADKKMIEPGGLGFHYYFLQKEDLHAMQKQLRASADKVSVITLNGKNGNCDFMSKIDGINNIYGLEFYGGNEIGEKEMPTFEEMCNKHIAKDAFKRLGVLRMDVDNLGQIFQQGILPERATLSRYAALSRSFDYFFSGYLNTIWKENFPEQSFIIYSGGDDVFIVGSWEITIKIAERIRNDFKQFTCENPVFSLSGGIAIVSPKYPIMKGAEESDGEEKRAKGHQNFGQTKNSVSFMGMPLNWEREFPQVQSLKDEIVAANAKNQLPKSFISKILSHLANAEMENHKIKAIKTYWMITYDLSRMCSRISDLSVRNMINCCKTEVCTNNGSLNGQPIETNYHLLELWAMACRWAELGIRQKSSNNV